VRKQFIVHKTQLSSFVEPIIPPTKIQLSTYVKKQLDTFVTVTATRCNSTSSSRMWLVPRDTTQLHPINADVTSDASHNMRRNTRCKKPKGRSNTSFEHATLLVLTTTQLVMDVTWDKKNLLLVVLLVASIPPLSCTWSRLSCCQCSIELGNFTDRVYNLALGVYNLANNGYQT
jgi:hypothetical protein